MIPSFLKRVNRRWIAFGHDVLASMVAFLVALYLRLGDEILTLPLGTVSASSLVFAATCGAVFLASGLYRGVWAFASLRDLAAILKAVSIAVAAYALAGFLLTRLEGVPRTVPFIAWFILLALLGGARMAFRLARERRISALWERSGGGRAPVLIVGADEETDLFIRAVLQNPQTPFRVVGVVAEDDRRVGRHFHNVEVLGTLKDLSRVVGKLRQEGKAPTRLVLTRPLTRLRGHLVNELLDQCAALGLGLSRLPSLTDLRSDLEDKAPLRERPIALEDLLGRPEIVLDRSGISGLVKGRRVLITGAGGTIGSELVRQIAALEPAHLTLVEFCEYNLYRIELETTEAFPHLAIRPFLADVRDAARLAQIFRDEKTDVVFHAAAIKHVPIAEANVREALLTNVMGTRVVADCAARANVLTMVMISTDKAVHPANVMGATKRLAEMYCQALDLASNGTRFITVRFGNVLGSMGSVVPRFQEQLAKGGPLTVTHPSITRYFMTVREAVELVLQASAHAMKPGEQRGKVMVLDMGQPVLIADLARQMIRLAGLQPDEDVKIVYTGLRPGEKLYEELFAPEEALIPSGADGVRLACSPTVELSQLQQSLAGFATLLQAGMTEAAALARLEELVPDFRRS